MEINTSIFKAYDIRGIYPGDLNEDLAYRIGQAYVKIIQPKGKVAVGMDVRLSSPQLKEALIQGLTDAGIDVLDVGMVSTEMIYFAVGYYKTAGGIQVTASHNPAEYNGFKMVRENVIPISSDNGIFEIRDLIVNKQDKINATKSGSIEKKDIMADFVAYIKDNFSAYWQPEDIIRLRL
jgi:phosphomannomutase